MKKSGCKHSYQIDTPSPRVLDQRVRMLGFKLGHLLLEDSPSAVRQKPRPWCDCKKAQVKAGRKLQNEWVGNFVVTRVKDDKCYYCLHEVFWSNKDPSMSGGRYK